jgi:hypothetical protein
VSDHDEPSPDEAALDDPELEELRGLLAGARVTEPVPAEVADRLDATLASLQQERADHSRDLAPVVPLRRRLGRVLVAAATVAVVGAAGVGVVKGVGGGSDSADSTAAGVAQDDSDAKSVPPTAPAERAPSPGVSALKAAATPTLSTAHFSRDVTRAMRLLAPGADGPSATTDGRVDDDTAGTVDQGGAGSSYSREAAPPVTATPSPLPSADALTDARCPGPDAADAVTLPATLDDTPVALVFRTPTTDAQVVQAWSCDGATLLASVTVPH